MVVQHLGVVKITGIALMPSTGVPRAFFSVHLTFAWHHTGMRYWTLHSALLLTAVLRFRFLAHFSSLQEETKQREGRESRQKTVHP